MKQQKENQVFEKIKKINWKKLGYSTHNYSVPHLLGELRNTQPPTYTQHSHGHGEREREWVSVSSDLSRKWAHKKDEGEESVVNERWAVLIFNAKIVSRHNYRSIMGWWMIAPFIRLLEYYYYANVSNNNNN